VVGRGEGMWFSGKVQLQGIRISGTTATGPVLLHAGSDFLPPCFYARPSAGARARGHRLTGYYVVAAIVIDQS
jgi:hypothetical protein